MANLEIFINRAISFVVFPSLMRSATCISFGVRFKHCRDSLCAKGDRIPRRLDSSMWRWVSYDKDLTEMDVVQIWLD